MAFILGIAGGSCSGKTTLAQSIVKALGPVAAEVLYQDSYYIDQSARFKEDGGEVNFDHPSALDFDLLAQHLDLLKKGRPISVPIYDFKTHSRVRETQRLDPKPLIVLDGTLILSQEKIRTRLDRSIFIATLEEFRFERRKNRDVVERGRAVTGVIKQFQNHVKPMHDEFVEPSQKFAQEIYNGNASFATQALAIIEILKAELKL